MKDWKTHAARTWDRRLGRHRGRGGPPQAHEGSNWGGGALAGAGPAGALAARHPARLVTIAVAVIACLAVALAGLPPTPARAAAHSPQPRQPVIQYLPHPVLVSPAQLQAQTTATKFPLVYICLSNADTHCLGTEEASSEQADGIEDTIVDAIIGGAIKNLLDIVWKIIFGPGSTPDRGDETSEDVGGDGTQPSSMKDTCLGANPTSSDGNDRVYPSSPSKCFGVLRQSWLYRAEPGSKTDFALISRVGEAEHRVFSLAQLNLRDGAYLYVKKNTSSGLWHTWSFFKVANCVANC
jgi:hypothetical protein